MFNALMNFMSSEPPPTKVIDARADAYSSRAIHARDDGLVLYSPLDNATKKNKNYEIVLHKPMSETIHYVYSLFRAADIEAAELKFLILKDKLPVFVDICKEMFNLAGLQKICDTLSSHPTWSIAHLAAHFTLYNCFNNPKMNKFLNSTDGETGISPIQVAIKTQNLKTVQTLISLNCSLEHLDHDENSVFHYAASTNKDIIFALTQETPSRCLNARNRNGYTPLHMACLSDKPDCVRALLLAGADVNNSEIEPGNVCNFLQNNPSNILHQKDMKFGGTPLHWACSRPVIDALVDMNCHVNCVNFEQKTPLHVMVLRNRLDCVVALLSRQADPDLGDSDGNRPIHLAIKEGNVAIIQSLIVFGADLNILNNAGETPRHMITKEQEPKLLYYLHAVGAERCAPDVTNCTDGCKVGGTYNGIPPPQVIGSTNRSVLDQILAVAAMNIATTKNKNGRLLCLDGGGIRGLVLVQILLQLEKILNKPIGHCFDWLAGTSTGGVLALAIASGKTMKECLCLYFHLKELTFVGTRPYPTEALETVLKETFGTNTVMADIKYPKIMVTGVLSDRQPLELHLFRNYESANDILRIKHDSAFELPPTPKEQLVWEVGKATGAAPTYFRTSGRYLDGGLIANNPTLDALTEIQEHCIALKTANREDEAAPVTVVASIGTGQTPTIPAKEIDIQRPESIFDSARLVFGIQALGTILIDQATQSNGRIIDRARAWCSMIGVPYFRLNPLLSEDIALDEKSDEKLCKMLWETCAYMHENVGVVKELADILNRE